MHELMEDCPPLEMLVELRQTEGRRQRSPLKLVRQPVSGSGAMKVWPAQDAKARFSELLDTCQREGPQVVSRRGRETAVLVPVEEWRRLQAAARPSLKQLLLAPEARTEALVPTRGQARRRGVLEL